MPSMEGREQGERGTLSIGEKVLLTAGYPGRVVQR